VTEIGADVPLLRFAIALVIGALVGIDREKKQEGQSERGIGGLRTFILVALAGALAAWLTDRLATPWVFVGVGVLIAAAVLTGYAAYARVHASYGLTTEVAAIVVYLLGGAAILGDPSLAVALAIATAVVLAFKEPLHGVVGKIGREDLYAGLTLLSCTFIVLPVIPDRTLDPWDALNPYKMWLLVILISGLSLVGYVATRMLGAGRGVPLTGLFGGLVSSTAVTLSFARRSREDGGGVTLADALASGILLSWAVMFARILVMVAVVNRQLLRPLLAPTIALGALCLAAALLCYWRGVQPSRGGPREDVPLRNPFSLAAAIRFALFFALVLLAVKLVQTYLPGRGVYGVAALAGLTDVDAITLSMAGSARDGAIESGAAVTAIVIAAISNSIVKAGLVTALATPALRRRVIATTGLLLAGAGATLFWG
jgi:uncharacterized membrane protein (DUF4010 family)